LQFPKKECECQLDKLVGEWGGKFEYLPDGGPPYRYELACIRFSANRKIDAVYRRPNSYFITSTQPAVDWRIEWNVHFQLRCNEIHFPADNTNKDSGSMVLLLRKTGMFVKSKIIGDAIELTVHSKPFGTKEYTVHLKRQPKGTYEKMRKEIRDFYQKDAHFDTVKKLRFKYLDDSKDIATFLKKSFWKEPKFFRFFHEGTNYVVAFVEPEPPPLPHRYAWVDWVFLFSENGTKIFGGENYFRVDFYRNEYGGFKGKIPIQKSELRSFFGSNLLR
jgi:hypothetical protein